MASTASEGTDPSLALRLGTGSGFLAAPHNTYQWAMLSAYSGDRGAFSEEACDRSWLAGLPLPLEDAELPFGAGWPMVVRPDGSWV